MKAIISAALFLFALTMTAAARMPAGGPVHAAAGDRVLPPARADLALLPAASPPAPTDSAAGVLPPDSSSVQGRMPSPESLEALRSDKDFFYLKAPSVVNSWWERFWIWLGQQFARAVEDGEGFNFWSLLLTRILPWTVALLAIILVTMKLLGINPDAILRKKAITAGALAAGQESGGQQEDTEALLEESLRRRDFRLAIRLYYLDILRQLSRAGLIEWHPDKTNRQYLNELNNEQLRERFGRLTRVFEYVWYGETDPGEKEFEAARTEFRALKGNLGTRDRNEKI